jgi:hypothetical protein
MHIVSVDAFCIRAILHLCISSFPLNVQLNPPHTKPIPVGDFGPFDAFAVDERAVGARQVLNLDFVLAGRQTAMEARDQRAVDDEISAV